MQLYFDFDEPLPKIYNFISKAYKCFDYIRIYDLDFKHDYFTHVNKSWRSKININK